MSGAVILYSCRNVSGITKRNRRRHTPGISREGAVNDKGDMDIPTAPNEANCEDLFETEEASRHCSEDDYETELVACPAESPRRGHAVIQT
jgi:hypothetical protein